MNPEILPFIQTHILQITLWAILLIAILGVEFWNQRKKAPKIKPQDVINQMNNNTIKVVDIRESAVFRQGHILNSRNLPFTGQDVKLFESFRNESFVLVCQSGQKATELAQKLKEQGFNQVFVLEGGLQTWQGSDLPLVKGK